MKSFGGGGGGTCGPSARAGNEMSCEESDLTQVPRYHALRVTESGGREAEGERGKLARKGKAWLVVGLDWVVGYLRPAESNGLKPEEG
jgi:hypothetical protein